MEKIVLTEEKETMLIPLFAKAKESEKKHPVIIDKKAVEIINQIDYDFTSLKIPEKTKLMMCLRAKLIDNFVRDFFLKNDKSIALHLGCGLDSRSDRIDNSDVDWYDVDFEEVIDIRKHFFRETDNYHLIPSSVTEKEWPEKIPGKISEENKQYIVIAEGLFMYLKEDEIKTLISRLKERIGSYILIFDAFSVLTAKKVKNQPSIKKTGATIYWGIDNPEELTGWGLGIQFIEEQYFTSNEEIEKLGTLTKLMFKMANLFSITKKAHRILIYRVS
ncbi:Tetracenomycin polyketide synthesis O-methyltransferase tcmP [Methanosarcina horonobensis HB-1 = JCM 15518]|uniref:Tetracenomycin polyketide synthesis O-methyltransferase tcmP n=1 Tax=Methanosarcina horonobensis HB-1 = JCM 15518 TaxID=1434110 RepID=A0A0E3S9X5_9EURY|nr:class I SAM-dependent methyltransferase [Methanosarcina horonobensis]AKB78429.1 Tetracenomycin polyketide synthesis O-methyltransferase tcmP [Methanosarcina horonobensis HB-1 = JCM 15518]